MTRSRMQTERNRVKQRCLCVCPAVWRKRRLWASFDGVLIHDTLLRPLGSLIAVVHGPPLRAGVLGSPELQRAASTASDDRLRGSWPLVFRCHAAPLMLRWRRRLQSECAAVTCSEPVCFGRARRLQMAFAGGSTATGSAFSQAPILRRRHPGRPGARRPDRKR